MLLDLPYGKSKRKPFCHMALVDAGDARDPCHMATTRIREFREAAEVSQEQLADAVGISVSQISRIERDEREPRLDEILKISARLRVPVAILIGEEDEPDPIPVVGRIGAGGAIDTSSEQFDEAQPLYEVEAPFALPDDSIAFEISGESMWPRYDSGDVIVCSRHGGDITPLIGWEAAVATEDGARYLKRILVGSRRGLFNLESHNAQPIRDVRVVWASEILAVIRASQVKKISDHARRRIVRALKAG
jgi:transcriptional regulator with XRE-family HTH domain